MKRVQFFFFVIYLLIMSGGIALAADPMENIREMIKSGESFRAYQALKPLAEAGRAEAQYELAGFYHYGYVGSADFKSARSWYLRSAKQGNPQAMLGLATMERSGQGGAVSEKNAFVWVTIASNYIIKKKDLEVLDKIKSNMLKNLTPEEIEQSLSEARTFIPRSENQ